MLFSDIPLKAENAIATHISRNMCGRVYVQITEPWNRYLYSSLMSMTPSQRALRCLFGDARAASAALRLHVLALALARCHSTRSTFSFDRCQRL